MVANVLTPSRLKLLASMGGYALMSWHCLVHHTHEHPRPAATQRLALSTAHPAAPPTPPPVVESVVAPTPEPATSAPTSEPAPAPPTNTAPSPEPAVAQPRRPLPEVIETRQALQTALDQVIGERKVEFASGSDVVASSSYALLDEVADVLRRAPGFRIEVQGHTDNVGNPAANLDMSARRAAAVARYLAAHGVRYRRILTLGHGAERPIADNATEEGRQRNRRIRFLVLGGL